MSQTTANILTELGGFIIRERENFSEKVHIVMFIWS